MATTPKWVQDRLRAAWAANGQRDETVPDVVWRRTRRDSSWGGTWRCQRKIVVHASRDREEASRFLGHEVASLSAFDHRRP